MPLFRWLRHHWFAVGLVAVCLLPWLAFSRSLFQDFASIDDGFLIINNPIVHKLDPQHVRLAFTTFDPELYIPLTIASFQLDWLIGGGSPMIFHLTNLLLQSANAVLVGVFVFMLFGKVKGAKGAALAVAAIFAVHPLNTEAVVWAAGRKDLLAMLFFLLTYIFWLRSHGHASAKIRFMNYVLALACFVLGLLSKVLIATLPAVLLLHAMLFFRSETTSSFPVSLNEAPLSHRRGRGVGGEAARAILKLAPFFLLSAVFLYIATFGKSQILASSTLLETAAMAQKSALFYLQKLIIPAGLTVIYPYEGAITLLKPEFFLPLLVHLALVGIALWQWKKRPLVAWGILFYYITLAPTFFNFHKGDLYFFAVDRYAYIPMIGILTAAAAIINEARLRLRVAVGNITIAVTIVVVIFIAVSVHQSKVWDSPDSLFGHAIDVYPRSTSARMALASILRDRNQLDEAFEVLREGLRYSDHPGLNVEAGLVYSASGQTDDAREQFRIALRKNPKLPPPMFYLGFLDEHDGDDASAFEWYTKAVDNDPSYVTVRVHLAQLLMKAGRTDEAQVQLSEALAWNPVSLEVIDAFIDLETMRKDAVEVARWERQKASFESIDTQ